MANDSEQSYVLVTSLGEDRPGIVEELAEWFLQHGGNIEESRMAQLGGDFAALVLVSGPPTLLADLESTRDKFECHTGQKVQLKPTSPEPQRAPKTGLRYSLRAMTLDHPGIVHALAHILRAKRVNIVSLVTHTEPAPFSGTPIFHIEMLVDLPAEVNVPVLRAELADIGARQNIDVVLSPC